MGVGGMHWLRGDKMRAKLVCEVYGKMKEMSMSSEQGMK